MALKLYHSPRSRSVRVLWTLEELGLSYELVETPFDRAFFKSPEWRAINPVGKTPVMVDGAERLIESVAIAHYLAEKYGEGKLARRPVDPDYGRFLQFLHFGEAGMGGYGSMLIGQTRLLPENQRNPALKAWAASELKTCCDFIESELQGRDFILGEDFSLADISLGYALYVVALSGEAADEILSARTKLYLNRLKERPAWKKAMAGRG
ncbi:MAG: glutathione S-transferase family protein [Amphiplicatus sp.]